MTNPMWSHLIATPLPEIRRRAVIIDALTDITPVTVPGARRWAWNDGGGQSAVWYFADDGRVLLLTFEHELSLNLYAEGDFSLQESLYGGVPESLMALVRDRPENYESLNLTDRVTGRTIHYAGGIFWCDGSTWRIADGLVTYCRDRGLDLFTESGFEYCLSDYLFGSDLTAETLVAARDADGQYVDDADKARDLDRTRAVFDRYA